MTYTRSKPRSPDRGSRVDKGFAVDKRDRLTRKRRLEQLDEDLTYGANELDRAVVAPDQIRMVIRTFRDRLFTEIFPGRTTVPKTLIFANDDSHAEENLQIVREEFGKGNDFCQKITYRTTGASPKELIQKFRNSYDPRIAVTVDMIAIGTDIKPLEIVMFMRSVKSPGFFEQMKGRGVRVISDTEFQQVTPNAKTKTHFVIVDAVGVCVAVLATNSALRQKVVELQQAAEQTIDAISEDKLIFAGADIKTADNARDTIRSFRKYIEENKAEIGALQILYSRPYNKRITEEVLRDFEAKLKPKFGVNPVESLWAAFEKSGTASPTDPPRSHKTSFPASPDNHAS
jgi:type I site-specific restriction endonuclease